MTEQGTERGKAKRRIDCGKPICSDLAGISLRFSQSLPLIKRGKKSRGESKTPLVVSPEQFVFFINSLFYFMISNRENIMTKIMQHVKQFLNDEEGVTALEYGMIAALIAAVIVGAVRLLGQDINTAFNNIHTAISGV
jgi:pilus assembly protein Flp/PilA